MNKETEATIIAMIDAIKWFSYDNKITKDRLKDIMTHYAELIASCLNIEVI